MNLYPWMLLERIYFKLKRNLCLRYAWSDLLYESKNHTVPGRRKKRN